MNIYNFNFLRSSSKCMVKHKIYFAKRLAISSVCRFRDVYCISNLCATICRLNRIFIAVGTYERFLSFNPQMSCDKAVHLKKVIYVPIYLSQNECWNMFVGILATYIFQ